MYVCVLHQINSNFQDIRNVFGPKGLPKGLRPPKAKPRRTSLWAQRAFSWRARPWEKDMKKLFRDVDIFRSTMIYHDL